MPNGKASANALPNGSQDPQAKQLIAKFLHVKHFWVVAVGASSPRAIAPSLLA